MQRFVLLIQYKGTNFSGSQKQPGLRTVQGELEKALCTLTKRNIRTIFSGRTDAGVHAFEQYVHIDSDFDFLSNGIVNSLNGILPKDMNVVKIDKASFDFHAQKSATERVYVYKIVNRAQRSAFDEDCLLIRNKLDTEYINSALSYIEGEFDFTSFKKSKTNNPARVCKVRYAKCYREGDNVYIEIAANRFLYGMVRTIVGTVLLAERKKLSPVVIKNILEAKDRTKAGPLVKPEGLTLIKVKYDTNNTEK